MFGFCFTAEDDVHDVYDELVAMADKWCLIATGLHIPTPIKSLVAKHHLCTPEECLLAVLKEWLKGVHDVQKYGHPSWCTLVKAVASAEGEAKPSLAQSIAATYTGRISYNYARVHFH